MSRTVYNKLVRDFIPKRIEDAGDAYSVRTVDEAEFLTALRAKVIEEATELHKAESRDEILGENADLMVARSAFERGIFLESASPRGTSLQ